MNRFEWDGKEIATAKTLPSHFYLDPTLYAEEKEKIFYRSWHPIGRTEDVKNPGDYLATEVIGEPVLLTRGKDQKLRAFSNVCRHRAALVASGKGNCALLKCPYHGWTYRLDGSLLAAPEIEGMGNFDKASFGLVELPCVSWGPMVFVRLSTAGVSFGDWVADIPKQIEEKGFDWESYRFLARREYVIDCNWKVYVDNYLEGYHIPVAHPELFKMLDYQKYEVVTHRYYSSQYAPVKNEPDSLALYFWLFPHFMLNLYPDQMHTSVVYPLPGNKTLTVFEWFLPKGQTASEAEVADLLRRNDQVQKEDITLCESVQKGLSSAHYDRGRYNPKRENGVHHFHELLMEHF